MSAPTAIRERVVTWEDPLRGARQARSMSGLDYLKAIARGEIPPPPIAELLQLRLEELDSGRAVFSVEPAEFHYNPIGVVHGGLAATILDSAMGCAVHTLLSAGTGYTTLDIHVNFVRPLTADTGKVKCEATVIHAGSRIATAEGRLVDASGKLYAHATSTLLIIQGTTNP